MSPLTHLYLGFSRVSGPLWRFFHWRRMRSGKELRGRISEKYGSYRMSRPDGTLFWFHALSVGESLALLPLIERALAELPDAHVLLTSSTATSTVALAAARPPDRCIHVFQPVDTVQAVRRFLDHWRPDVAGFSELDFWPRLMIETKGREIPMILVNSRMPEGSFRRRRRIAGPMRDILGLFDRLLVQDETSVRRFAALGADARKISVVGTLKSAARPLPAKEAELAQLRRQIGGRPVWLAAATHQSEHSAIIEAHAKVREGLPEALMILAPRHVRDGDAAEALLRMQFAHWARRGRAEWIEKDTQVYLADTIGEMGLWYRLAPVSFVGHSLVPGLEGKNPFEAVALGSCVLHGPETSYFAESYRSLDQAGGAIKVANAAELASNAVLLQSPASRKLMHRRAAKVATDRRNVLDLTWSAIREVVQ
ncbi:MAG: 3-deoxy-D-manno-octulosonic acid transferase [Boseongicola sp. SB0664_bin_43]|uniref:3-deoxy-D-manno-octulosonic acid transferase n=1 Tax=Boseongicola sp. SB0664_bin_43 TaxID=2604844 RepID=A0A6B0XYZ8_9RHOB|nr:3-deoxy-D-manno-octulosonic acid transferase [Boseongicola sp. SB0664_bin_43]